MRKLSCDGASRGFESDTVPFIIILGTSERLFDGEVVFLLSDAVKAGNIVATPVAALTKADLCRKFRRLILF
jgi:hypothetical protein